MPTPGVYFKPATDYAGTVASGLTLRAWDQTSGVAGSKVDTSTNGWRYRLQHRNRYRQV